MRGVTTIDRQPGGDTIAIWVTSRTDMQAGHTNAVTIDVSADPKAMEKVRSLTRVESSRVVYDDLSECVPPT